MFLITRLNSIIYLFIITGQAVFTDYAQGDKLQGGEFTRVAISYLQMIS